ncbi:MAG: hypothetical protein R2991_16120 [Thermoanaerobaculia bacterium]
MRSIAPATLLLLAVATTDADAAARCVAVKGTHTPPRAESVGLIAGEGVPPAALEGAVDLWASCPQYGSGFPRLLAGTGGTRTLRIDYDPTSIGDRRCGSFRGRRIVLHRWIQTEDGRVLSCGPLALNLAHELGHALGLEDSADPACDRFVMAPILLDRVGLRRPRPAECAALAAHWWPLGAPPTTGTSRVTTLSPRGEETLAALSLLPAPPRP